MVSIVGYTIYEESDTKKILDNIVGAQRIASKVYVIGHSIAYEWKIVCSWETMWGPIHMC